MVGRSADPIESEPRSKMLKPGMGRMTAARIPPASPPRDIPARAAAASAIRAISPDPNRIMILYWTSYQLGRLFAAVDRRVTAHIQALLGVTAER